MKRFIALVLVAAIIVCFAACGENDPILGTTTPTTPTGSTTPNNPTEPTVPVEPGEIHKIDNYTGDAESVIANRDTVVATMDGIPLTNSVLQIYYWLDVYDFLSNYSVEGNGLDLNKPLHTQSVGSVGTWQHYFLSDALVAWNYYQAMAQLAKEENVPLNPYFQRLLDGLDDELWQSASESGFETVDAMIQSDVGPGATIEDYRIHRQTLYAAQNYCYYKINSMSFTHQQIEDYFIENQASLAADGIHKDLGDCYRVRHILLKIEPDAQAEDWDNLRTQAQALLDQWLAGDATEESFAALATEHSVDPGSANVGGLYQGLTADTSFLQPFKEWYLDESRKVGDYGLVKTTAGYHIMYFSGTEPIWEYYCREMLVSEEVGKIEDAAMEKYEVVVHYDKILLGEVSLVEDK